MMPGRIAQGWSLVSDFGGATVMEMLGEANPYLGR